MAYDYANRGGHTGGQNRMPREAAARERYVGDRDEVYEVQVSRNLQQQPQYRNDPVLNDAERGRGAAREPRGAGGARNDTFHREPHMNQAERQPTAQDFRGGRQQVEGRERFAGDRRQDFGYERNENFQRADPSMREYVAQQVLPEIRGQQPQTDREYEVHRGQQQQQQQDQRGRQQQQDIPRRNVNQQAEAIYEELPLHEREQNYDYPPSDNHHQQPRRQERERPQASGSEIDPHIRITSRDNAARALVNYGNEQIPAYAISPASNQNPPLNHERMIYRDDPDYDYPPGGAPARHGQQMHNQVIPQREPQRNIGARVQQPRVEPYAVETEYDIPVQEVRNPPMDPYQNSPRAERVDRGRRAESPIRVQQQNYQQNRQPSLNQGRFGPPLLSQQEQYDLDQQRLQQQPQQQQQQRQPRHPAAHQQPPRQIYNEIPHREEPVQQHLQQRARQQAPAYQQTENVYDEIHIRDNRADREESDHQRGRRHVEGIYENPSLHEHEHNYDYPPSDFHHQRHPEETNPIYEQPPAAQNNRYPRSCTIISMRPRCGSALDESQGNHVARDPEQRIDENVEVVREAPLPEPVQQNAQRRHENVEVITEENSQALLPEPGQWNIRRIVPRQNRNHRNNNNEDFNLDENFVDNSQNHHRDETLNEDVDGWDTPPPQQQGAAGGHDNHVAAGQQRQPSNEGNESGFFDGDGFGEPSYRPRHSGDGGPGGFARRNFNNYDSGRGENGGPNGYNGYQQNLPDSERSRAPKDYVPRKRQLQDIYNEDRAEINKYGNAICDNDAEIEVAGQNVSHKCDDWHEMELPEQLLLNLKESEYLRPRNIQKYCFPYIDQGFNIQCQSETGSGKTVAFLVPIIENIMRQMANGAIDATSENPIALIIAPTRELVGQLFEQALKLTNGTNITVACAYGQYNVRQNIYDISQGCNILCACVGRLLDLLERKALSLRDIQFLVLDEPDRLLRDFDDGCDILKVMNHTELPRKSDRQTLLFSATLCDDANVQKLAIDHIDLDNCVTITAKKESNCRIKYVVIAVPSYPAKFRYLIEYLKEIEAENDGKCPKVLVFTNRRIQVEPIAVDVTNNGFPATTIHGGRAQDLREEAYEYFRNGKATVLVATDVCARGVDIHEMDYVINYDLPEEKTGFLQRCGRTGRTHPGVAVSFYCPSIDSSLSDIIHDVIQESGQIPPEFLRDQYAVTEFRYGTKDDNNNAQQNNDPEIANYQEEDPAAIEEGWD